MAPRCVDGHGGGGCSVDERLRAGGEVAADRAAALRPMRADPATAGWIWRDGGCSCDGWLRARGAEAQRRRREARRQRIRPLLRAARAWFRLQRCVSGAVAGGAAVDPAPPFIPRGT